MTDRDKLIELIKQGGDNTPCEKDPNCDCTNKKCRDCEREGIADHLLANGVIVPPCDIGQTVYPKYGYSFKIERFIVLEDKKILFRCGNDGTDDYMAFYDFEIGTDVFLTKEEAEIALAERKDNNG